MRSILFLLALGGTLQAAEPFAIEGRAQGTTWHIRYTGSEKVDLKAQVDKELAAFDKIFSNYRPDSDINRFNQQNSKDWFPVDPDLVHLVQLSNEVSRLSNGAFDITVGPLLKVWGFGPFKTKEHKIPGDAAIATALKDVDYRQLEWRLAPPALKKNNPALYVDLSGVAQGYSVDRIAAFLDSQKIPAYMVEIGGEIQTRGVKAPGKPWTLAIDAPEDASGLAAGFLHLEGRGLTTAGDYRDYFEKDGKRYSHTIDPRTGRPVAHNLASVTVVADKTWEADAWDTALMVLGPEGIRQLAPQLKSLALFLIIREGKGFRTETLGGFEKLLIEDSRRSPPGAARQ